MKKGVVAALFAVGGAALGAAGVGKTLKKKVDYKSKMSEKHLALYLLMNQWVKVKQENKSIADYLEENGYKEIAIYGMNYVGETLLDELTNSNVKVKYAIDKNANSIYSDVDVVTPDDELTEVDAVIVTAITFFDEIEENLSEKMDCPILSMEDILYEV
ncbi:MAG: hypothetical protein K2O91_20380 [Lachnospiraceae bacterium]|nr:hypothetical protein [Lachnospiraceae bacterium]